MAFDKNPKNGMGRPRTNWEERNYLQPKCKKRRRKIGKQLVRIALNEREKDEK
jgi:hypothetical protein